MQYKGSSLAAMQEQAVGIINTVEREIALIKLQIEPALEGLHDYVYKRELPYINEDMHPADELGNMMLAVGGCIDFVTGHGYLGLSSSSLLQGDTPLQLLLAKAESYLQIDFPDYCTWDFYTQDREPLRVFSLEMVAELAGRSIGSVRNASLKNGDLKTVRIDGVVSFKGEPVGQSVFVEYEEACKWLALKNSYEPLKQQAVTTTELMAFIRDAGPVFQGSNLPNELLLREKGALKVFYAPFEHINVNAKVVLCGITPGAAQAEIALNTLAKKLREGMSEDRALKAVKESASFAGSMRNSLSKMLDHVGLNSVLGIDSCAGLFDEHKGLVHHTSALKNPVFFKEANYAGNPLMLKEDALKWQIDEILSKEVQALGEDVLYIPLGPKPAQALLYLVKKGYLKQEQILLGIPHPSGANAERIKYFCEEKERSKLSTRTNAEAIDEARSRIKAQLAGLTMTGAGFDS